MTDQQVFNFVRNHLLSQGAKSMRQDRESVGCAYRGKYGLKCAVGCLIPDDEYHPNMEGKSSLSISCPSLNGLNGKLLYRLQVVHDLYDVLDWKEQLQKVAQEFNLEF